MRRRAAVVPLQFASQQVVTLQALGHQIWTPAYKTSDLFAWMLRHKKTKFEPKESIKGRVVFMRLWSLRPCVASEEASPGRDAHVHAESFKRLYETRGARA